MKRLIQFFKTLFNEDFKGTEAFPLGAKLVRWDGGDKMMVQVIEEDTIIHYHNGLHMSSDFREATEDERTRYITSTVVWAKSHPDTEYGRWLLKSVPDQILNLI